MASFRSFLARERLVAVEQLDRALQRQILYGEDLGVNLLEIGAVDEDELSQFLGMFYHLPIVTRSDLDSVPDGVAALVPEAAALKHRICPAAVADRTMVVAATRPFDRDVSDDLANVTGHFVSVAIATPVALAWGLHRHYGAEFPSRYARIVENVRRKNAADAQGGVASGSPAAAEPETPLERPRRVSGIIVLPGDLPESETGDIPPEGASRATASATSSSAGSAASPADFAAPFAVGGIRAEAPPAFSPEEQATDELLRGLSLADATAADRLFQVVLGLPADAGAEAPRASVEPEAAAPAAAPAERPSVPPRRSWSARSPSESGEVMAVRAVVVDGPRGATESVGPPQRSLGIPAAVESLVEFSPRASSPVPATGLMDRIARMDAVSRPYDVLRYAFYLFSAEFRCGLLIDTTGQHRVREAFGVLDEVGAIRDRPLPEGVMPQVVCNAAQPLLTRVETDGPLGAFVSGVFGSVPRNALFLPVVVGHRVVAVMYGDNRALATSFEQVRDLFHVAWAAGERLVRLARDRRSTMPP